MNKKDKNIKIEDAVIGEYYKIEVDKDTTIWEHQWIAKYDGLIVEYLGKQSDNLFYPYEFKLIMGDIIDNRVSHTYFRKPGDTLMFNVRDSLTLKKL
jgi:hypothetical protein